MGGTLTLKVPYGSINTLCRPCPHTHLSKRWGKPKGLTQECQNDKCTNPYVTLVKLHDNWKPILTYAPFGAIVSKALNEVKDAHPTIYDGLVHAGSLCVRKVRGTLLGTPSNHCWATAIDMGYKVIDPYGDGLTQPELLVVYSYFKKYGVYWGAGFGASNPKREDSMHFEVSRELLPLLQNVAPKHTNTAVPYHTQWIWLSIGGYVVPRAIG